MRRLSWTAGPRRRPLRPKPLSVDRAPSSLTRRLRALKKCHARVGSAGLGACVCGQIDVRMMLYTCKHFAIKMWLGVADF